MTGKAVKNARLRAFFCFLLLFAQACIPAALGDDAEMLKALPGQWTYTAYGEDPETGADVPEGDLACLTLEEGGKASLLCRDRAGNTLCVFEGVWSFQLVSGGMDRLTLAFSRTDHPLHQGREYSAENAYNAYMESWVENDTEHAYLILEKEDGAPSPFTEVFGEEAQWSVALHRERGPNMRVVYCKEFVSLREERSASSRRLAKVPLGAAVLAFPEAGKENGFILCVYHDEYGYILSEYLEPAE